MHSTIEYGINIEVVSIYYVSSYPMTQ